MGRLIRALDSLSRIAGWVAGAMVLGLTGLIASAVFARWALGSPILAADELSSYALVGIVFLGLAYTMKTGGHVRADIVLTHVPPRVRAALELGATALAILFTLVLLAGNWLLVAEFYARGSLSFKYLQIPLWIPATLLIVGTVVLLLQVVAQLIRGLTRAADA